MAEDEILHSIKLPDDIKSLNLQQLAQLSSEIRELLIKTVPETGGHFASNLGVVELTVAIHAVFDSPRDTVIFDVGHQSYTHKILTGRLDRIDTLRQEGGISGFPKTHESEHDGFISGHASNSISAAFGIERAKHIKGDNSKVIAVIGDGAFSGGLAYEGLNNAGRCGENLIVILNDNEMSISKNVGALAKHMTKIRSKPSYFKAKDRAHKILSKIPFGRSIEKGVTAVKRSLKTVIYRNNFFEQLGFVYLGPVDGHNLSALKIVLNRAKSIKGPVLVHVDTVKGKGFNNAEENPGAYHGIGNIDILESSQALPAENTFSAHFGKTLTELAQKDDKICAVTAAMKYGTGLNYFQKEFNDRFFDVGIAEEHAVTFSAGLARGGMIPVFAVYSTFLQRAYDQIIHDAAIEQTHIVLCVDRAGIVGDDGETHQGLFDVAMLSTIPNVQIFSPISYDELSLCLSKAIYNCKGVAAVRYPRGGEPSIKINPATDYEYINSNSNTLVITYGRIYGECLKAKELAKGSFDLLRLVSICPIAEQCRDIALKYSKVIFVEEGIKNGSVAQSFGIMMQEKGYKGYYKILAVDNCFVGQATVQNAIANCGFDAKAIAEAVDEEL